MIGWIGDYFRFWWSLFYWNARKSWFRIHGAHRDDCPCQNASDSGLAFDTRCDAVMQWQRPARFRRVCPLLTETKEGWRCSVEAEGVRPFWGRAVLYAAVSLLAVYLAGTVAVYAAMRAANYDVRYFTIAWPARWKDLRASQERLYVNRAQLALRQGNYQEAILSLEMVCQLNPRNYSAGIALAGLTQVAANPFIAEHIYERLMHDVPEQRVQTAQIWFRTLLGRADYDRIMPLAATMLSEDPAERGAWLNALLFAARQTGNSGALAQVLQQNPHLPEWCTEIIGIEQALLENQLDRVLPRLTRVSHYPDASYYPYYQVHRLLLYGRAEQANELLTAYGPRVQPDEASFLRLCIFQALKWNSLVGSEYDNLLQYPMVPRIAAQFCAYLIAHPATAPAARYCDKFLLEGPPLTGENLALYQATYLVAVLAGDTAQAGTLHDQLSRFTASDTRVLHGLEVLLKTGKPDPRLARILPLVPLPAEVVYAILERQAAAAPK